VADPPFIGIYGGIGSGKSTVAALFAQLGASVIDSDAVARELTAPGGNALDAICAAFGPGFLDASGALDRARMRALVFAHAAERLRLEAILHPRIGERSRELAVRAAVHAPVVMFDLPLLVEAPELRKRLQLDRILVVDCPVDLQRARAQARGTMAGHEVDAVIAIQASRAQRLAIADDVIVNADTLESLRARVDLLWRAYVASTPTAGATPAADSARKDMGDGGAGPAVLS